ncbi:carboxypeptidase regulatory-like domain-containing protein [Blastopirellula marina]|uniref:Carboxypeptidase regulatory-like domain-containing protein n=2 Tax=Pirellulales TaxID=2691354 RepID=A0A2S8FGX7_9BACT|nr:carboxypeptidase regulatory-like domain-containing protein [Blastopirellula marina]RCS51776.1 carboxypeptidase regulatory-like domain-containing protein [Bremerella cremea]
MTFARLLLLTPLMLTTGCFGSDRIVPVSGVVTLDGEPLSRAVVGFEPIAQEGDLEAGYGSYAKTDDQGRYALRHLQEGEGALVGQHRVSVSTVVGKEGPNGEILGLTKERVPARYNNNTELVVEVPPGGTDEANLELVSK